MDIYNGAMKEHIIMAAIWFKDGIVYEFQEVYGIKSGFVIAGFRHPYIHSATEGRDFPTDYVEGFVTSEGVFVDRAQGMKIAIEAGQVKNPKQDILWSEDIYPGQRYYIDYGGGI